MIAHIRGDEPLSPADLAEHERTWHAVEDEMRACEEANERAEELL